MTSKRNLWINIAGVSLMLLVLAGCSGNRSLQADGLPGDEYLVGGGMMIDWEAPATGTAYLVEKTTGKVIETRSLDKGDRFSFSLAAAGPQLQAFEHAIGINFSEARLLLYFHPDDDKKGFNP